MINYDPHEEGNGTGGWITPPRRVRGNARRALAVPLGCVCTPLGAGGGDARPAVVARRNMAVPAGWYEPEWSVRALDVHADGRPGKDQKAF